METTIDASALQPFPDDQFDVLEWHPYFQSCVRYFLDHAQYASPVQALAAFLNIQLPFQKMEYPVLSSRSPSTPPGGTGPGILGTSGRALTKRPLGSSVSLPHTSQQPLACVTVVPYLRRLVATGCDSPAVLHGFFGDDWSAGIGWFHEQERRNYMFAAKSDSWLKVKAAYDMGDGQTIPFLRPLQNVDDKEIVSAERTWSDWLAMQDWMIGPRAPEGPGAGNFAGESTTRTRAAPHNGRRRHDLSPEPGETSPGDGRTKTEQS